MCGRVERRPFDRIAPKGVKRSARWAAATGAAPAIATSPLVARLLGRPTGLVTGLLFTVLLVLLAPPLAAQGSGPWLYGSVRAPGGEPAVGASVELRPWAPSHRRALVEIGLAEIGVVAATSTDQEGRFEIRAPEIGPWVLTVTSGDRPATELRLLPLVEDEGVGEIVLPKPRRVVVEVLDEGGSPVAGARVVATPEEPRIDGGERLPPRPRRASARTGEDGRAELTVAQGHHHQIEAVAAGFLAHAELLLSFGDRSPPLVSIVLPSGPAVLLEARDELGRPVAGAVVSEAAEEQTKGSRHRRAEDRAPMARGVTDERGRLGLPAGARARQVSVEAADLASALVEIPAASEIALEAPPPANGATGETDPPPVVVATLRPAVTIRGAVTDRATGKPIAGALVWSALRPEDRTATTPEGRFELTTPVDGVGLTLHGAARGFVRQPLGLPITQLGASEPTFALEPAGAISGVVTDPEGAPVAGAELTVAERTRGRAVAASGAITRHDGSYRLAGLLRGLPLELLATHRDFAPRRVELPVLSAERPTATVDVELTPGLIAHGVVVDESERPVPGARAALRARGPSDLPPWMARMSRPAEVAVANSDSEGRFRLTRVPPGEYDLEVSGRGWAPTIVPGVRLGEGPASNGQSGTTEVALTDAGAAGGGSVDIGVVVLLPGADLVGRVVDPEGRPVAGAKVSAVDANHDRSARWVETEPALTDDDGSFVLPDRVPNALLRVSASHPDYQLRAEITVRPPSEPLTVVVDPVRRLRGRVLGADGELLRGALLRVTSTFPGGATSSAGQQAEDGRFDIRLPHPGPVEVTASGPGHRPRTLSLGAGEEPPADLVFRLEPGATLSGVVRDTSGDPVVEAFARATMAARHPQPVVVAVTDGAGAFLVDGLAPGALTLEVRHRDYLPHVRELEIGSGETSVDIELDSGLAIEGVVLTSSGEPAEGATVSPARGAPPGGWSSSDARRTGSDGRFELRGLEPDLYTVVAHTDLGWGRSEPIELRDGSVRSVVLQLEPGATVAGRVAGVEFESLANVRISARSFGMPQRELHTRPDFDGRFTLAGVPAGGVQIVAIRESDGRRVHETIEVTSGAEHRDLVLDFGGGATLSGVVRLDGAPTAGVVVTAVTERAGTVQTATDQAGHYELAVPAGPTTVNALLDDALASERLDAWGDVQLDLELDRTLIVGTVLDRETGRPVPGARVIAQPDEPEWSRWNPALGLPSASSDAGGAFGLAVLPGRYRVRAAAAGYSPISIEDVEVFAGDEANVSVELAPALRLTVVVRGPDGDMPPAARVQAFDPMKEARDALVGSATTVAGRVELDTLPSGAVVLVVRARGLATKIFEVVLPGPPELLVTLDQGGAVRVSIPELEPSVGGAASAHLPGDPFELSLGSASIVDGVAVLSNLPAGPVRIRIQTGGAVYEAQATVLTGATVEAIAASVAEP